MALDDKDDETAPISREDVSKIASADESIAACERLCDCMNQKRDAYNGIVSSMIYILDAERESLNSDLKRCLIKLVTSCPQKFGSKIFVTKVLTRLTREHPIFVEDVFETIIEQADEWSPKFLHAPNSNQDYIDAIELVLRIKITSLKAVRQAEQTQGGRPTRLSSGLIDNLCDEAVKSCDDHTKIDTLALILESKQTTKPLAERELAIFKVLFADALSLQVPSVRQAFLSQTNKLIKRISDSHRVVLRDSKLYSDENRHNITRRYLNFLEWLIKFCVSSIYCNAYFGSYILTISTMKFILEHVTMNNAQLPINQFIETARTYDTALSCLTDSFEDNKKLALEFISVLPHQDITAQLDQIDTFEKVAYQLATSVNPAHSLTCQYIFRLHVNLRTKQMAIPSKRNLLILEHLERLVDSVDESLRSTQRDFVNALKNQPIYPKLTCIRALIEEVDVAMVNEDRPKWVHLCARIVSNSIEACRSISAIVCNLNPETIGHLPMDLNPIDSEDLSKFLNVSLNIDEGKLNTISSQMLLICGWKTIKECSLSLGTLCQKFWWPSLKINTRLEKNPGFEEEPILSDQEVDRIIDFFIHYLQNLRHRGAFEQAYNGFLMITKRIWNSGKFKQDLIDIIDRIISELEDDSKLNAKKIECLKAYVTRRSAGLPFIIIAVLNAEPKQEAQALRSFMDRIFKIIQSEQAHIYQKIHCLNILTALTKEHTLGEKTICYAGQTLEVTFSALISDSFPIRNCANMLLKAAIDRVFGINRLRGDIHRRNQLSFERFFKECPNMNQMMIDILNRSVHDRGLWTACHAVMIVLARLVITKQDERDSHVRTFYAPLRALCNARISPKLQQLAASHVVRLFANSISIDKTMCAGNAQLYIVKNLIEHIATRGTELESAAKTDGDAQVIASSLIEQVLRFKEKMSANTDMLEGPSTPDRMLLAFDALRYCFMYLPMRDYVMGAIDKFEGLTDSMLSLTDWSEMPHYEELVYLCILIEIMTAEGSSRKSKLGRLMCDIIRGTAHKGLSHNIGAALLRLLRQSMRYGHRDHLDDILDQLDIDRCAAHLTPFDELEFKPDSDVNGRKLLAKHCTSYQIDWQPRMLLNLADYAEFQLINDDGSMRIDAASSNTPRAVELLALICRWLSRKQANIDELIWSRVGESVWDKLQFAVQFASALPDCDVKIMGVLCASHLLLHGISGTEPSGDLLVFGEFAQLIDELTNGDHEVTVRAACAEAIGQNINAITGKRATLPVRTSLIEWCSALIKLSQDEDPKIRLRSERVMRSFCDNYTQRDFEHLAIETNKLRLHQFIHVIVTQLFDLEDSKQLNDCIELLTRIIFNHAKNYSTDLSEERERLFDKTKLNTYADHVATVQAALDGLHSIHEKLGHKLKLSAITIPEDVVHDIRLSVHDDSWQHSTGSYERKGMEFAFTRERKPSMAACSELAEPSANESILAELIDAIIRSIGYFEAGYWVVLTDTEYTYHELQLYKRIAYLEFLCKHTDSRLDVSEQLRQIRNALRDLVTNKCSTCLLNKCLELMSSSTESDNLSK